jgi:hypothetical protein
MVLLQSTGCGTPVPLEQGIYGAQKRTEQGIFVLFRCGTGNLPRGPKSAASRLYCGDRPPAVTADPAVAENHLIGLENIAKDRFIRTEY